MRIADLGMRIGELYIEKEKRAMKGKEQMNSYDMKERTMAFGLKIIRLSEAITVASIKTARKSK